MGIGPFRSYGQSTVIGPSVPNPTNFKILSLKQVGKYVVAEIQYPGCTNFEGEKICIFKNTTIDRVKSFTKIDPHFAEDGLTPIARFIPTEEGYDMAVRFCEILSIIN